MKMRTITTNNTGESFDVLSKFNTASEMGFSNGSNKSSGVPSSSVVVQPYKHSVTDISSPAMTDRSAILSKALLLPNNIKAYSTLNLRRISPYIVDGVLKDIISDNIMSSQRERRCLQRLTGSLLIHEPAFDRLPFFPYVCTAASLAIPTSPITALELALHIVNNIAKEWREAAPLSPDEEVLKPLDLFFRNYEQNRIERLKTTRNNVTDRQICVALKEIGTKADHNNLTVQLIRDVNESMSLRSAAGKEIQQSDAMYSPVNSHSISNTEGKRAFLDDDEEVDHLMYTKDEFINRKENDTQRVHLGLNKVPNGILRQQDQVTYSDAPYSVDSSPFVSLWEFLQYSCGASCHDYFWLPLQTFLIYSFLPADVGHHQMRSNNINNSKYKNINYESNRVKGREEYLKFFDRIMLASQSGSTNNIHLNNDSESIYNFQRMVRMSQYELYATAMALVLLKRRELLLCTCKEEVHLVMCSPLFTVSPDQTTTQRHRSTASSTCNDKNPFNDLKILTGILKGTLIHFMTQHNLSGIRHIGGSNLVLVHDSKPFPTDTTHYPVIPVGSGIGFPSSANNNVLKLQGQDTINATAHEIRKAKLQKLEEIEMDENEMYRRLKNELTSFNSAGQMQELHSYGKCSHEFITRSPKRYRADGAIESNYQPWQRVFSADERASEYNTKCEPKNEANTVSTSVQGIGPKMPSLTTTVRGDNAIGSSSGPRVPDKIIEAASLMVMAATGRLVSVKSRRTISNNRKLNKNSINQEAGRQDRIVKEESSSQIKEDSKNEDILSTPDNIIIH